MYRCLSVITWHEQNWHLFLESKAKKNCFPGYLCNWSTLPVSYIKLHLFIKGINKLIHNIPKLHVINWRFPYFTYNINENNNSTGLYCSHTEGLYDMFNFQITLKLIFTSPNIMLMIFFIHNWFFKPPFFSFFLPLPCIFTGLVHHCSLSHQYFQLQARTIFQRFLTLFKSTKLHFLLISDSGYWLEAQAQTSLSKNPRISTYSIFMHSIVSGTVSCYISL